MDALTTSLLLAALFVCCCYRLISYYYRLETKAVVPTEWPVLGHLVTVIANIHRFHDWVTGVLAAVGHNFEFRGGLTGVRYLFTCDPSNVRHIFTSNFGNYPKGAHFAEIFDVLGGGIFTADGDSWRHQRAMIQRLFTGSRFRAFAARCSRDKVEKRLLPLLADAGRSSCDLQDMFMRLAFDVACGIVFGMDPGCLAPDLPEVPFARAIGDASETCFLRHVVPAPCWKLMRRLGVGPERKMATARKTIDGFVAEAIAQRRHRLANSKLNEEESADDLLSSFLCHDDDNFGDEFLRDMTVTLLVAGRDGMGITLSWFFYLLSKNPRVEQRLLHELSLLIASRHDRDNTASGFVTFDASELGNLVYLHAALCECLRLYPPIPFEHKSAAADDVLPSGHEVKAGETVLVFSYSMGRMEGVWGKDCMEFVPERWITQDGKLRYEPSYKFFAFNMKTVVAAMLWNFAVEVVPEHVVQPKLGIFLYMKNGLAVRVKRRGVVRATS